MILHYIVHKQGRHLLNLYHCIVEEKFSSILSSLKGVLVLIWIVVWIVSFVQIDPVWIF